MMLVRAEGPPTRHSKITEAMPGQLSEQPFAELLRECYLSSLSGAVRLERERDKAVVYLEDGKLGFAASNLRELRLAEYLRKRNLIADAQLDALGANRSDAALVNAITTNGVLNKGTIQEIVGQLVADTVRVTLLWPSGTWEYDERARLAEASAVKLDIPGLLIEASRKMGLKFVSARMSNPAEVISPVGNSQKADQLQPAEAFILSRLDQPMTLAELVQLSGQREMDALRGIYGLALAGYLLRSDWPAILPASKTKSASAQSAPQPNLAEEDLHRFLARIDQATNHYEILDVPSNSDPELIKRSYYNFARRFHPDRFHGQKDVHARLESAFASITQAYETLTDISQRNTYDARLSALEKLRRIGEAAPKAKGSTKDASEVSQIANETGSFAERSFKEGFAALQLGHVETAITHLAAAVQANPRESRYRAYYGRALASTGRSQRLAETELQAAIRMEPNNTSYRLMLAQLYYELAFYRRARSEIERLLELDPNHGPARALLEKLAGKN
jgi:curved DNA-binding protein CbpA